MDVAGEKVVRGLREAARKLRRQQESKTKQQADAPHIYYHDVALKRKVAARGHLATAVAGLSSILPDKIVRDGSGIDSHVWRNGMERP